MEAIMPVYENGFAWDSNARGLVLRVHQIVFHLQVAIFLRDLLPKQSLLKVVNIE